MGHRRPCQSTGCLDGQRFDRFHRGSVRRANAPALEAYPLDADQTPSASGTGFATTFERAGFTTVLLTCRRGRSCATTSFVPVRALEADTVGQVKQDIREAFRFLSANPGFAAVVMLTLGLAIGVNSTIFSVVNGVLLRPLAYTEPDRLVGLWERNTAQGLDRSEVSAATCIDWRERTRAFERIAWPVRRPPDDRCRT
jgi:hypothetical protein